MHNGVPLVRLAAQAAQDAGVERVVVVLGAHAEQIERALDGMKGVELCVNRDWNSGIASSLRAGLAHIVDQRFDGALVCLSDQPHLDASMLRRLIREFDDKQRLVAAEYEGVIGVPALFGCEHFAELAGLSGDVGAGRWLRERGKEVRATPMDKASIDVDTAGDVASLNGAAFRSRADYGIDAPVVVRNFLVLAVTLLIAGFVIRSKPVWGTVEFGPNIPRTFLIMGVWFGITAVLMLWGSRFGKLRIRDNILDAMNLQGTEQVLDVGCGHGLMLIGAAKRLTTGKAHGIDIWNSADQADNSQEATLRNARAEGVESMIELRDGDARHIPFADNTFDVVLSSWVIHNMKSRGDRTQAVSEIARVLKPGGRLAITDISHARDYARQLERSGFSETQLSAPSFVFVIPSHTVSAIKNKTV